MRELAELSDGAVRTIFRSLGAICLGMAVALMGLEFWRTLVISVFLVLAFNFYEAGFQAMTGKHRLREPVE